MGFVLTMPVGAGIVGGVGVVVEAELLVLLVVVVVVVVVGFVDDFVGFPCQRS